MTDTKAETNPRAVQKRPFIVRLIGLTILIAAICYLWWQYGPVAQRGLPPGKITATGTIEATEVDVSSEIGGRLDQLLTDEGRSVEKGDMLAKTDDSRIRAEVERAEAALKSARATLEDLEAGARLEELESARAGVELAHATLDLAEAEWRRAKDLFEKGILSESLRDSARANLDVAKGQYDTAQENLRLLEAGFRPDQIEAAQWQVKQAEAALKLANVEQKKTEIFAPIAGVILVKDSEQGEVILPGVPIVTIADLDDMWVKIYIDETNIGRIKLGQKAGVKVDSFPDKEFAGEITYISDEAEFTPKNIQTREDRVKLVFAVKIGIDNAGGLLKPGMYADIELDALSPGK